MVAIACGSLLTQSGIGATAGVAIGCAAGPPDAAPSEIVFTNRSLL